MLDIVQCVKCVCHILSNTEAKNKNYYGITTSNDMRLKLKSMKIDKTTSIITN
jgi:hypothetical protein